ncbi:MAG: 3D domain-containing protein [Candidatus Binatia bacterium]
MITHCVTSLFIVSSLLGPALLPARVWSSSAHDSTHSDGMRSSASSSRQPQAHARRAKRSTSSQQVHQKHRHRRRLGHFRMTAYTQHTPEPRQTASGTMPAAGRTVAVDPKVIPLGSKIEIEGIGIRIAEDTGGMINGNKLDLYLPSRQACIDFGVKTHEVYLLE